MNTLIFLVSVIFLLNSLGKAAVEVPQNIKQYLELKTPSDEQSNNFYDDVTLWAEKDLKQATTWAYNFQREKGESDLNASTATLGVIRAASKLGPEKTFEWIKTNLETEKERLDAISSLIVVEAFKNTKRVEIAEAGNKFFNVGSNENIFIAQSFFNSVPSDQENDVVQYGALIKDPDGLYKSAILGPVLDAIAQKDFVKASKIWSDLENGNCKNLIFSTVIEKYLNTKKPSDIVQWINSHDMSFITRSEVERKMYKDWYLTNEQEATRYFIERSKNCQPSEIHAFVSSVEEISPYKALELITKIEDPSTKDSNLDLYAYGLYKNNLVKFEEIYKTNTNPEVSLALRKTLFNIYCSENPKKACLYYQDLTQSEKDKVKVFFWLACGKWFEADSNSFMQWARTLQKDEFKSIIFHLRATSKKFSSDENVKYIAEEMPLGPKRDEAFSSLVDQKAMKNPEEAILWAFSLKNESEKVQAIQKVLIFWSVKDPAAACDWITDNIKEYPAELEPSFLGPFVLLSNKDKKAALEKSKKIQNPKLRQLTTTALRFIK